MKRYSLIYADPPWQYRDSANAGVRGAAHKYPVMSLDAIKALHVRQIAADDCLLAMWHVPPMPREALEVVDAWGFRLVTFKGLTWHKTYPSGKSFMGMGHWSRGNTEDCLFAVRGSPRRVSASVLQYFSAPIGRHSEKPDKARRLLVELVGDVRRIELFCRERRPGWHAWGNEFTSDIQL